MADAQKSDAMKKAEEKGMTGQPPHSTPPATHTDRPASTPHPASTPTGPHSQQEREPISQVPGSAVGPDANTGADRVSAVRAKAHPAGLAFHSGTVHDLQNIYASIRDGNYFQGFKQAISFLHDAFNGDLPSGPETPGRNVVRAGRAPMAFDEAGEAKLDDICGKLSAWSERSQKHPQMMTQSGERFNPAKIGVDQVAMLVQMILQLIGGWRGET